MREVVSLLHARGVLAEFFFAPARPLHHHHHTIHVLPFRLHSDIVAYQVGTFTSSVSRDHIFVAMAHVNYCPQETIRNEKNRRVVVARVLCPIIFIKHTWLVLVGGGPTKAKLWFVHVRHHLKSTINYIGLHLKNKMLTQILPNHTTYAIGWFESDAKLLAHVKSHHLISSHKAKPIKHQTKLSVA